MRDDMPQPRNPHIYQGHKQKGITWEEILAAPRRAKRKLQIACVVCGTLGAAIGGLVTWLMM